jgi:hypothetical protein
LKGDSGRKWQIHRKKAAVWPSLTGNTLIESAKAASKVIGLYL